MNVPGVPDSVPWSTVKAFLESLGLDLAQMPAECGGVVIANNHIKAIVYALDTNGKLYIDRTAEPRRAATHEVRIPIIRDELAEGLALARGA